MTSFRSRSISSGRLKSSKNQSRIRSVSNSKKGPLTPICNSSLFADFQSEEDISDISKIKV